MKYIFIILIGIIFYQMVENKFHNSYEQGYADGVKNALKTNPPSDELELTCVGLWIGEQNKKYWEKNK